MAFARDCRLVLSLTCARLRRYLLTPRSSLLLLRFCPDALRPCRLFIGGSASIRGGPRAISGFLAKFTRLIAPVLESPARGHAAHDHD
jgi:hypothetical protein